MVYGKNRWMNIASLFFFFFAEPPLISHVNGPSSMDIHTTDSNHAVSRELVVLARGGVSQAVIRAWLSTPLIHEVSAST